MRSTRVSRAKHTAVLALFALGSLPVCAQEFTAIVHGEVIDGRGGTPIADMSGPVIDGADPQWQPYSMALASTPQLASHVKKLKAASVDVVKAYGGLSDEQLRALAQAAEAESLRVLVDAGKRNGTASVAASGIFAFAHLGVVPVTDETTLT